MISLFGFPAISSCRHSGYAKDKGQGNEKIPDDIAQIQNAAAGYSGSAQDGKDRERSSFLFSRALLTWDKRNVMSYGVM